MLFEGIAAAAEHDVFIFTDVIAAEVVVARNPAVPDLTNDRVAFINQERVFNRFR